MPKWFSELINFFMQRLFASFFRHLDHYAFCTFFAKFLEPFLQNGHFSFFQKCPKSKTANESRSTFFLGSLLTFLKYNYFIWCQLVIELINHVYQYKLFLLDFLQCVHYFYLHRLDTYYQVILSLFEKNDYNLWYLILLILDVVYSSD